MKTPSDFANAYNFVVSQGLKPFETLAYYKENVIA